MKEFQEILKHKRNYYGETEAAIDFAAQEYARQFCDQVEPLVSLPDLTCNKCNGVMKFLDGHAQGTYGTDYENCDDPNYSCKCGNKIYLNAQSS